MQKNKCVYEVPLTKQEFIGAYRNRVETMDIAKVEEYADKF